MNRSARALRRIALTGACLTLALAASATASAASAIHFEREGLPALAVQVGKHEVHALTFHPTPAPGHVHVSMNDGRHFTVSYAASEQARLVALGRGAGVPITIATAKPKAAKTTHHTLRYIAAGIVIVVIIVVAAVLLVDRRRKLREEDSSTTPAASS